MPKNTFIAPEDGGKPKHVVQNKNWYTINVNKGCT
jgi:hypothetical protein